MLLMLQKSPRIHQVFYIEVNAVYIRVYRDPKTEVNIIASGQNKIALI
jgi:hypothetical protein